MFIGIDLSTEPDRTVIVTAINEWTPIEEGSPIEMLRLKILDIVAIPSNG